jgi:hypothetical protein
MNIKDVPSGEVPGDKLEWIFARQAELRAKYDVIERQKGVDVPDPLDLQTCRGQQRIKDLLFRCIEELCEASGCLKNRPWKQSEVTVDVDHFYEELADALHFYIEVCLSTGLDAKSLLQLYFKKSAVNQFRQRSDY